MDKMKELYEKVAKDSALQAKFADIMKVAEEAGLESTKKKLAAFAKDAGFDVTLEEVQAFFKELSQKTEGELSDTELDMVAGGKSRSGKLATAISIVSAGVGCVILSADALTYAGSCNKIFD
jgi:predicted ribosomally synthesized peptide with nif11-like leader